MSKKSLPASSAFVAMLCWMLPQLGALGVSVWRVPLWAKFPQPGEDLALPVLLCVQMGISGLLLPLFRPMTTAVARAVTAWPLAILAGILSGTHARELLLGEFEVTLWIVLLGMWNHLLRSEAARAFACAVAAAWTVGGAVLVYLRVEFSGASPPLPDLMAGPLIWVANSTNLTAAGERATLPTWLIFSVLSTGLLVVLRAVLGAAGEQRPAR